MKKRGEIKNLFKYAAQNKIATLQDAVGFEEQWFPLKNSAVRFCEECGEKIGAGRLRVMPLAKSCVNCQKNLEKELTLQRGDEEDSTYRGLAYASGAEEEEA